MHSRRRTSRSRASSPATTPSSSAEPPTGRRCSSWTATVRASCPLPGSGDSPPRTPRNGSATHLGPAWRVAAIGPAGERLVRYATVSHDGRHAGRGGLGAVLGSKNIKAVAVRGARRQAADRRRRARARRRARPPRPLVRPRHRQVPRARHARQPPLLQRDQHAPHAQLQRGLLRGGAEARRGGAARAAPGRARELRLVHDRLRAHLRRARRRHHARGVRERLRARPAVRRVRPRRRPRRQPPLRRPRHRHRSPPAARSPGRWSARSAA